jgi:hypothetical protein
VKRSGSSSSSSSEAKHIYWSAVGLCQHCCPVATGIPFITASIDSMLQAQTEPRQAQKHNITATTRASWVAYGAQC